MPPKRRARSRSASPPRRRGPKAEQSGEPPSSCSIGAAEAIVDADTRRSVLTLRFIGKKLLKKRVLVLLLAAVAAIITSQTDVVPTSTSDFMPAGMVVEDPLRPGLQFDTSKIRRRHPVVMIPGFVSTALEVWKGRDCISSNITTSFRQRMFSAQLLLKLVSAPQCYLDHISLRFDDAGDPDGICLRPDYGLDAADFLVPGFWVWGKIIINLADIGYRPREMHLAAYDWRLSPALMEARDSYMSGLRARIETMVRAAEGLGVVAISHSYGSNVFAEFVNWVDQREPGWTNRHVKAFASIGGPFLGIPKALAAAFSGEFKDTAMLPGATKMLLNSQLTHKMRTDAFRSWPCLHAMLPLGPRQLWENIVSFTSSHNALLMGEITSTANATDAADSKNRPHLDATSARSLLAELAHNSTHTYFERLLRRDPEPSPADFPVAPQTTVFCIYGVSIPSEEGYIYAYRQDGDHYVIDETSEGKGVRFTDGDGTVPLSSLGYMCRSRKHGWPRRTNVVTVEHPHVFVSPMRDPRGGVRTADHVDIMGNYHVIEQLLNIATGNDELVVEHIESDIDEIVRRVDGAR